MKSGVLPVSHKVQEIYWLTPNTISGLGSWRVHLQPGHCGAMAHGLAKNLAGIRKSGRRAHEKKPKGGRGEF